MKKSILLLGMFFLLSAVYAQHKIGERYLGGIIYDVDSTGSHGLIADKADLGKMGWVDAIKKCKHKGLNWHLPEQNELNLLYNQKIVVGGFANYTYWSSSQNYHGDPWYQSFRDGYQFYANEIYTFNVRAVRTF